MPKAVKPVTFPPQPRKKNGMIDPAAPKIIAILLVHRFDRNDALGNSRSEFRVWAKPRENSLVPRCAAEPRVRSTHQFDGIAALGAVLGLVAGCAVRVAEVRLALHSVHEAVED